MSAKRYLGTFYRGRRLYLPVLLLLLAATVLAWVRADAREAAAVDARLDAERAERTAEVAETAGRETPVAEPVLDRPWWETDPRFAHRRPRP